jgi:hypothetical protein
MIFFPSVALAGTLAVSSATTATMVGTLTAGVVKDFFMNLFLNPSGHFYAVLIVCGVIVAPCIGLAFLIKVLFEKCFPPTDLKS